jgi:hypothetical protein
MFKTISRFASSFAGLLTDQNTVIDIDGRLEKIRDVMIDCLLTLGVKESQGIAGKVAYATDVQTLWYLRSEMMAVLASHFGEEVALKKLDVVTDLFRGVVSDNQMPSVRRFKK